LGSATGQKQNRRGFFLSAASHIDGKPQLQYFRRLIEKTGGDDIIKNTSRPKRTVVFWVGSENRAASSAQIDRFGKQAHIVWRRNLTPPDRSGKLFSYSNPNFHVPDYGHLDNKNAFRPKILLRGHAKLHLLDEKFSKIVLGGNSPPAPPAEFKRNGGTSIKALKRIDNKNPAVVENFQGML